MEKWYNLNVIKDGQKRLFNVFKIMPLTDYPDRQSGTCDHCFGG